MLDSNSETTATAIAQGVGFSSAKDITNRLNALHKKNIIHKVHRGKKVFWTIVEENVSDPEVTASTENLVTEDEVVCVEAKLLRSLTNKVETLTNELSAVKLILQEHNRLIQDLRCESSNDTPIRTSVRTSSNVTDATGSWSPIPRSNRYDALAVNDDDDIASNIGGANDVSISNVAIDDDVSISNVAIDDDVISYMGDSNSDVSSVVDNLISSTPSMLNTDTPVNREYITTRKPRRDHTTDSALANAAKTPYRHAVDSAPSLSLAEAVPYLVPKMRMKKPLVAVVGDSMLKRMSAYDIRKKCRDVNSFVRPFIGATIEEMHDYIKPVLRKKPDVIILHIGTNNLDDPSYEGEEAVIDELHEFLGKIQEELPNVIIILSLPTCRKDSYNGRVKYFNTKLIDYCREYLINYIPNDNINFNHLNRGKLHLNIDGSKVLCSNISSFINFIISHCFPV